MKTTGTVRNGVSGLLHLLAYFSSHRGNVVTIIRQLHKQMLEFPVTFAVY